MGVALLEGLGFGEATRSGVVTLRVLVATYGDSPCDGLCSLKVFARRPSMEEEGMLDRRLRDMVCVCSCRGKREKKNKLIRFGKGKK